MQLAAFTTHFSFGGRHEHRIWLYGDEVTRIFRYYVKWHDALIPYLYSLVVQAHRTGARVIEPLPAEAHFMLGPDIMVAAMVEDAPVRDITLPPGDEWVDAWSGRVWPGRTTIEEYPVPLDRYPVFIRRGAMIPMHVTNGATGHGGDWSRGALTLDIYPEEGMGNGFSVFDETMNQTLVLVREKSDLLTVDVTDTAEPLVLRVLYEFHPRSVTVNGEPVARIEDEARFAAAPRAWRLAHGRLWVKAADTGDVQVECRFVK